MSYCSECGEYPKHHQACSLKPSSEVIKELEWALSIFESYDWQCPDEDEPYPYDELRERIQILKAL